MLRGPRPGERLLQSHLRWGSVCQRPLPEGQQLPQCNRPGWNTGCRQQGLRIEHPSGLGWVCLVHQQHGHKPLSGRWNSVAQVFGPRSSVRSKLWSQQRPTSDVGCLSEQRTHGPCHWKHCYCSHDQVRCRSRLES